MMFVTLDNYTCTVANKTSRFIRFRVTIALFMFTWLGELILTADCSIYLIWTHWFWLLILHLIWGARQVRLVSRGCLLLHGTWSHLWYIQRSVYAHSLICISYKTYGIDYWSLFLSFHYVKCKFIDKDWNKILDTKSVLLPYNLYLSIFGNFLDRSVTYVPHYRWRVM
jgi:hypothetical protein